MSDDLVTPLRNATYLAFEDGTNDYTTPALAAARIAKLEAALRNLDDMIVDLDAGHRELHDVSRFINAALEGGKDDIK